MENILCKNQKILSTQITFVRFFLSELCLPKKILFNLARVTGEKTIQLIL